MNQDNTKTFPRTIGMDLGNTKNFFHTLDRSGNEEESGFVRATVSEMGAYLDSQPASRFVIEASTTCHWVAALAEKSGHEVIVANPREFRVISSSHRKTDKNDARILAQFGYAFPQLLHPVKLRGRACQRARSVIAARAAAKKSRNLLIHFLRSQATSIGVPLPKCKASYFHKNRKVLASIPESIKTFAQPLLESIASLNANIGAIDVEIERLCTEEFPETTILRQIAYVGPQTALIFMATIEDHARFKNSRDVGAYTGLVSISQSSGAKNPQLRISKRGDKLCRRLLVNAASNICKKGSPDTDLKRYGEHIAGRGGQAARGKARIAVARKLGVLLHRLWVTGEVYEPLRNSLTKEVA